MSPQRYSEDESVSVSALAKVLWQIQREHPFFEKRVDREFGYVMFHYSIESSC